MDENLEQYATPRQWELITAAIKHGSDRKAGKALGVNKGAFNRARAAVAVKAARYGYAPDHDLLHPTAPGFKVRGSSTLYDMTSGEAKLQWLKTDIDKEAQEEAFRAALVGFKDEIPATTAITGPLQTLSHLLTLYPVGDHHFGMLAWGEETGGEDYDLKRGEELLCGAMDHLVRTSPASQQAAIAILGDFMHYDGMMPVTPTHGHLLDADSRFPKMVRAAIKCLRYLIARALEKHEHVRLIIEIGNHDLSSAVFMMECFEALYENEPRVEVDNSPRNIHCMQFGKNMLGTHHGHKIKVDALAQFFANDFKEIWGGTTYRYFHTCHDHHDRVKEVVGGVVEGHRILAPADAHSAQNYRSLQSMKAIVYHAEYGEVARHTVNPAMLDDQ
ncbi:MAG: oxidoreductase [Proteobacteria bacterium]|nr:oxidoreductase [Pseudomonadota bacterium]